MIDKLKYKVTFGGSKSLDFATQSKVIEAFAHNDFSRVTVIFKGLCAFTFVLNEAKTMDQIGKWTGKFNGEDISCSMQFSDQMKRIEGHGHYVSDRSRKFDIEG